MHHIYSEMDSKLMESYFDNIAERIIDENKIVTYKSLSRSLGIHVNTAKQLLYAYLTKEKYKNSFPVSATYLVAGKVVDGSYNITIVNEADLKNSYADFIEITSEHVYSVQKGERLKELKILCGIGQESSYLKSSNLVIECSKCVLKIKSNIEKNESHEEENKKLIRQALVTGRQRVIAVESDTKNEIANQKIKSESSKKLSPKRNSLNDPTNIKKPIGNIVNLFAKAVQKNTDKSVNKVVSKDNLKNEPKEIHTDVSNKTKEVDLNKSECNAAKERHGFENGLKRKKKGDKRKRIQLLSDSEENDSDDDIGDSLLRKINLEEEIVEPKEKSEKIKQSIQRSKKKKRKVIDRTVINDDGYLETKKKIVFETDSEIESEESTELSKEQNRQNIDKSKDVLSAGTAKKQSSLLTFFKKA